MFPPTYPSRRGFGIYRRLHCSLWRKDRIIRMKVFVEFLCINKDKNGTVA